jgi:hypothetical protein
MLLRASGEAGDGEVDLSAVTDGKAAERSGVAHAGELVAFAEAVVERDDLALSGARTTLRSALGDAALVDAAAVTANFQRMVRIADATGIPLDGHLEFFTEDIRNDLGLARFGSSVNTPAASGWQRGLRRVVAPLVLGAFRTVDRFKNR